MNRKRVAGLLLLIGFASVLGGVWWLQEKNNDIGLCGMMNGLIDATGEERNPGVSDDCPTRESPIAVIGVGAFVFLTGAWLSKAEKQTESQATNRETRGSA